MKNIKNAFKRRKYLLGILILLVFMSGCRSVVTDDPYTVLIKQKKNDKKSETDNQPESIEENILQQLPKIKREFRGVWVASVSNINWPSKRNLSIDEQKKEIDAIIDKVYQNNLNAIILQVRPMADALYDSPIEPWSYFLTGVIGTAPQPYYDPLKYWIEKAHEKNIELHAWINPYRAHHSSKVPIPRESMVKKMPQSIVKLANGMYWYDPASKETQEHLIKVVKDITTRYDIDGIHLDDYFYPYPEYNNRQDFPDNTSWNAYVNSGGSLEKADWRRANVNYIVKRLNQEIKKIKPYVKFGISPFGIYKSGVPEGIVGLSQYDVLYADAKLWLNEAWVDYMSPQLYWPTNSKRQNFKKLLEWWQSENNKNIHLWPGLNTVNVSSNDKPKEILSQIDICQKFHSPDNSGQIHWSFAGIDNDFQMQKNFQNIAYKEKAITPRYRWLSLPKDNHLDFKMLQKPNNFLMMWNVEKNIPVQYWIVYKKYGNEWSYSILPKENDSFIIPLEEKNKRLDAVGFQYIDRAGMESKIIIKKVISIAT